MTHDSPPSITLLASCNADLLIPLLRDADEDDTRIAAALAGAANATYLAYHEERPIAAAVVQWHPHESEIIYIAVTEDCRGRGFGKQMITALLAEARQR